MFLFGFAKNERDNIGPDELAELEEWAELASASPETIAKLLTKVA